MCMVRDTGSRKPGAENGKTAVKSRSNMVMGIVWQASNGPQSVLTTKSSSKHDRGLLGLFLHEWRPYRF